MRDRRNLALRGTCHQKGKVDRQKRRQKLLTTFYCGRGQRTWTNCFTALLSPLAATLFAAPCNMFSGDVTSLGVTVLNGTALYVTSLDVTVLDVTMLVVTVLQTHRQPTTLFLKLLP